MAFRLLKEYLGMSHWWSSKRELILMQIWVVLILAHVVYALRERIALAANCDSFEVSVPILVDLLPQFRSLSTLQIEQFVQAGQQCGLLRASSRLELSVPQVEISCYQPAPLDLPRQRPGRAPSPRRARAPKPSKRVCGDFGAAAEATSVQRGQDDQSGPIQSFSGCSAVSDRHLIYF